MPPGTVEARDQHAWRGPQEGRSFHDWRRAWVMPARSGQPPIHGARPNRLWVSDFTYGSTWQGFVQAIFAELIHRRAPWKTREAVELATFAWVVRFNHHRLLKPLGYISSAEAEAHYYKQLSDQAVPAGPILTRSTKAGAVKFCRRQFPGEVR